MSEFSPRPRPFWQLPAAVTVAAAMVVGAVHLREAWDDNPNQRAPVEAATSLPPVSTTEIPTTTLPEFIGPAERLEEGFLVDGTGLRFDAKISRGVDCQKSYQPDEAQHAPGFNEAETSLQLPLNPSLLGEDQNIMFLGEETSETRLGNYKLSHGWAIKKDPNTDSYTVYIFQVKPGIGIMRGEALGRPIRVLSPADLRGKVQEFQNDTMTFSVRILSDPAKLQREFLSLTIKCRDRQ